MLGKILTALLCIYQWLSRHCWKSNCRFYPTCSEYMKISVMRFGVIEGIKKGLKRLWRCQPFFQCGCDSYGDYIDLVPEKVEIQINIKSKD